MDNQKNEVLYSSIQKPLCEIVPVFFVLLLPLSMITLAHNQNGVIVGTIILLVMIYGIVNIYKLLYGRNLTVFKKNIVFKHNDKEEIFEYLDIENIETKKGFINGLCDTATLELTLKNKKITLVNVKNYETIKDIL
ncbi:MAG: hypothetical protein U9Q04_05855 [Campylobacterota bacterium]|nr:hypothetical protein [Campylobacterota bacterium]